jgi:hypothetical protein
MVCELDGPRPILNKSRTERNTTHSCSLSHVPSRNQKHFNIGFRIW